MNINEITIGSQNVFEDVGFSLLESENLRIRSELMDQITTLIEVQNWSLEQSILYLGISIETLSALNRGKIGQFSIEELITMLTHAGMKIHIEVMPVAA